MTVSDLENDQRLPTDVREQLGVVRRNVDLEARLIDDLLDSTRIATGKLQLRRTTVAIDELIARAVAIVEGDARLKSIQLEVTKSCGGYHVDGDPARLQQVIWNLLKNAVKFTPEGGWVRISSEQDSDGIVRVRVQDNGVGIESEHLGTIFNAFEQGDASKAHQFGGLGLGLAISRALVKMHHGSLWAESEGAGKGATFIMELPLAHGAKPADLDEPSSAVTCRRLRLLVVEDHKATASVMIRLLSRRGHTVCAATTISEALACLEQGPIDLLVSDVGLPDGSGRDLMEKIRQTRDLPGIALSGYGTDADVNESTSAGFSAHLTKPVDIDRLEREIQALAVRFDLPK
jgi:CheY-like chemotaxis protein